MLWLYNFALWCYVVAIHFYSLFNKKAELWINGRVDVFNKLEKSGIAQSNFLVWMHVASLGEFEQGRPIIEALKRENPDIEILLTFFSPSGYEVRKKYSFADYICYLPIDTKKNAKKLIRIAKPKLAIFIKYDLWYHYLNELQKANTPTLLVSALFRNKQFYFRAYGRWFLKVIRGLNHIFVQNEASRKILVANGIQQVSVIGDTRVDRVNTIAQEEKVFPIVESFLTDKPVFIVGSTWPEDENILAPYINQNPQQWKYIIAPHDVQESRIQQIEKKFHLELIRFSESDDLDLSAYELLILDNVGMLSQLYRYANLAYIGGGFGTGIHNTLEPIAFGVPVIFGPKYHKFTEATWLVDHKGGFSISSPESLEAIMAEMERTEHLEKSGGVASKYIKQHQGATRKVLDHIQKLSLLP